MTKLKSLNSMRRQRNTISKISAYSLLITIVLLLSLTTFSKSITDTSVLSNPIVQKSIAIKGYLNSSLSPNTCTGPTIVYTTTSPRLDGIVDASWSAAPANAIGRTVSGNGTLPSGFSAQWQAMYDNTYLYVLVQLRNALLKAPPPDQTFRGGNVELEV
jgi:hypothetical protein